MRVPLDSPENVAVDLSFGTSKICSYSSVTGHPSVAGPARSVRALFRCQTFAT
jgi:hypothetical protein